LRRPVVRAGAESGNADDWQWIKLPARSELRAFVEETAEVPGQDEQIIRLLGDQLILGNDRDPISAFMGIEVMQRAFAEAIREGYRFYSYGDACLLLRSK
jgi:hypothetical protein